MLRDFEKVHLNSISSVFPIASISCLFHLSQNVYRKVCEFGFKERFHHHNVLSIKIKCFLVQTLLSLNDVFDGFKDLVMIFHKNSCLTLNYYT